MTVAGDDEIGAAVEGALEDPVVRVVGGDAKPGRWLRDDGGVADLAEGLLDVVLVLAELPPEERLEFNSVKP